jgi:hypothetical protein
MVVILDGYLSLAPNVGKAPVGAGVGGFDVLRGENSSALDGCSR